MRSHRPMFCLAVPVLLVGMIPCCWADTILESASVDRFGGGVVTISSAQFLGARFTIPVPYEVDHVGGDIESIFVDGGLFAAIIPLGSPEALPDFPSGDIDTYALAHTTFDSSGDLLLPLSVHLDAGSYALVFGSGEFGATGVGGMNFSHANTDQASYFYRAVVTYDWVDGGFGGERFVVTGTPAISIHTPEPASILLLGSGLGIIGLAALRRRK